jgi:hypothetical protein
LAKQTLSGAHLVLPADPSHDPVLSVLARFEDKQYIHVYQQSGSAGGIGGQGAPDSRSSAAGSQLIFKLPRYNLSFQLQQGKLWSMDHSDWYLAPCQQLVNFSPSDSRKGTPSGADSVDALTAAEAAAESYTLPGFSQYLVLQQEEPGSTSISTSVLMPAGLVTQVEPESSASLADSVRLDISDDCNAGLQVSC